MDYTHVYSVVSDIGSNINPVKASSGISSLVFDSELEILWSGTSSGHVTSFYSNQTNYTFNKYTSFHVDFDSDIRQLHAGKEGILSLCKNALRLHKRRGLPIFSRCEPWMKDLRCMLHRNLGDQKGSHVFLAGNQDKLVQLDLATLKNVQVVDLSENTNEFNSCLFMKGHPKFICLADGDGKIVLRDMDQMKVQHQFNPTSAISSFDVSGNSLITCSSYSQLLMIYDIRQMKLISATQIYMPAQLKFLSRFTTKCCIVSRNGQFAIVDVTNPSNLNYNSKSIHFDSEVTALDVASTDQVFAMGTNQNVVNLYATHDKFNINPVCKQPEFADSIMPSLYYSMANDFFTPASEMAPYPFYVQQTELLSYMPPAQSRRTYRPVPPISAEVLSSMRLVGDIGYIANTPGLIQMATNLSANGNISRHSPEGNEFGTDQMPHRYHFLEPNHNKVDKDEYDFSRYNRSPFPGLDSTLPNSYANNMIQCLYYIPQLRAATVSHVCLKEYCLTCELGFLFHMLDIGTNLSPCQASNFLRAFRTIHEASAFKLILPDDEALRKQMNYCKLTQQWLRFLLHQLHRELNTPKPSSSSSQQQQENVESVSTFISDSFSLDMIRQFECSQCKNIWTTPFTSFPVTLNYPINNHAHVNKLNADNAEVDASNGKGFVSFVDLLLSSILTQQTIQSHCDACGKFRNDVVERRLVHRLPNIFAINTGLDNETNIRFWQTQISLRNRSQQQDGEYKNNIRGGHKYQSSSKSVINFKACRYGRNCVRGDCRFYHAHLDPTTSSYNLNLEECNSCVSWFPTNLYMLNENGSLLIAESLDNVSENRDGYIEYQLVNVTSVVKSGEDTFGNIVSAVKVDKAYLHRRKKMILRKRRRHAKRKQNKPEASSNEAEEREQCSVNDSEQDEEEEEEEDGNDDHDLYTVDGRSYPIDFELLLRTYKSTSKSEWFLFNHYSIHPVGAEEVTSLELNWKIPTTLMYVRSTLISDVTANASLLRVSNIISSSVLANDICVAQKMQNNNSVSFIPLDLSSEMPKKGDIVAMDAEFVMLNHEETELRSDGTRTTIRPSHKSVARISCVRGSGPLQGIPFIDDYITTQDQVADYMTKFSGIQPGDLDVTRSSKHLTTLKLAYLKLRFLIDNGVIFIGHGLRNDFRVINLVVPPEQVIDTVYLYQSPNSRRMVSLRFLAWHFHGLNIQSETHDSVEDAKTALSMYHKFKELDSLNMIQAAIEELYKTGKECGFKPVEY